MEFLTLHQLSRELDKPEKTLRYRFNQLKFENQLVEGVDYIRDDFVDEQHFVYKINPVTFLEKTKLHVVPLPDNNLGTNTGTKEPELVTNVDTKPEDVVTKPDTNIGTNAYPPDLTADFIAVLKEQLKTKDEQLSYYRDQVKDLQEINNMAMGEVVQLNRTIRQLAAPKPDTKPDNQVYKDAEVVDTNVGTNGYQTGTKAEKSDTETAIPPSVGEESVE
jgi:hypothetical protein